MSQTVNVKIRYSPRPLQQEMHRALRPPDKPVTRFAALAIHRRFGKTVWAVAELVNECLTNPLDNVRCAYICPTLRQARSVAWDYIKDMTREIPNMRFYETDLRVEFPNGARIQLSGAENFEVLRGNYYDLVVLDEFGNMNPLVWKEVLRPALSDRMQNGIPSGRAIFLGTPNGKNHFFNTYKEAESEPNWLARTYSALETGIIPQQELDDARRTMGEEAFRQEYCCDWTAQVRGAFYSYEMSEVRQSGRILTIPLARQLPVDISFDLGLDDATSVWFSQSVHNEVRLIDFKEWTNTPLLDVLDALRKPPYHQYRYGKCWLPHDAEVRSLNDGKTRTETIENSFMFEDVIVTPRLPVEEGINAARMLLPQCFFDIQKTQGGIDCLDNYRKVFDPKTGIFKNTPIHDVFSNGADSFRILALNHSSKLGDAYERAIDIKNPSKTRYLPRVVRTQSSIINQRH